MACSVGAAHLCRVQHIPGEVIVTWVRPWLISSRGWHLCVCVGGGNCVKLCVEADPWSAPNLNGFSFCFSG